MKDRQQCVVQYMCTADWFSEICKTINTLKLWLMTQELAWNQRFKGLLKFLEAWNTIFLPFILGIQQSNKEMHSQWALSEWISKSLDQTEHQERPSATVHKGEAGLLKSFCPPWISTHHWFCSPPPQMLLIFASELHKSVTWNILQSDQYPDTLNYHCPQQSK